MAAPAGFAVCDPPAGFGSTPAAAVTACGGAASSIIGTAPGGSGAFGSSAL